MSDDLFDMLDDVEGGGDAGSEDEELGEMLPEVARRNRRAKRMHALVRLLMLGTAYCHLSWPVDRVVRPRLMWESCKAREDSGKTVGRWRERRWQETIIYRGAPLLTDANPNPTRRDA
eukprot:GHVU01114151.1.p1 GENE.GHVU01114151.1~~GHVU01114151.1.p1  ORF type:complete len:118 (+),score=12.05 GHVU01114151.1:441-794(+)